MGGVKTSVVGLLAPFYHNSARVNKKIRGALGGDFGDIAGSDYGSDCSMRIGIYRFKYAHIRPNLLSSDSVTKPSMSGGIRPGLA